MPKNTLLPGEFDYVNQYHKETVRQGKARLNKDKSITTVKTVGVEVDGMIYNVPGFDRESGLDLSPEEAKQKHGEAISKGQIKGIPAKFDGPIESHPANVLAKQNHKALDKEVIKPDSGAVYWRE